MRLLAGGKNGMRSLWTESADLLRPQDPSGPRPLLWRHPGVPGVRGAAGVLPELRRREAGAFALAGQQPLLHQTVRLLCRAACRPRRSGMWLANSASIGGRSRRWRSSTSASNSPGRDARPEGDRHRRTLPRQRAQLPHLVSDLVRDRPIWFGGTDRSEKSMDLFFRWLGPRKCRGNRLAVMDMWKPFRNSTLKAGNAPQAGILYDKFHILKHLNEALDKVRKQGVRPALGEGPAVHQGPEVHAAVPPGQPLAGGASVAEGAVEGQPEVEQGLPAQGDVQPTVGLQARGVGTAILRPMEDRP